jgi:hypothetical protein
MFTVTELLAWNSLLRVGACRSPHDFWMTAFSISQPFTGDGEMTEDGRRRWPFPAVQAMKARSTG